MPPVGLFLYQTNILFLLPIELDGFCQHATEKHELSKVLFGDKINSENSEVADIKIEPAIEMYDNNDMENSENNLEMEKIKQEFDSSRDDFHAEFLKKSNGTGRNHPSILRWWAGKNAHK